MDNIIRKYAEKLADELRKAGPSTLAQLMGMTGLPNSGGNSGWTREILTAAMGIGIIKKDGTTPDGNFYLYSVA
jgi:hypothetical protein